MVACVTTSRQGSVGLIRLARPPVNALGAELRRGLYEALEVLDAAPEVSAIVLHGSGRGFSAGGDIHEFGSPAAQAWPGLSSDLHPRIEACSKPVVAAVHGLCLGGGLETVLACHWRIAARDARVGLPEVKVGSLPLSGTQRLPRLVGLQRAAELIAQAQVVPAEQLAGAFDALVDGDSEEAVVDVALAHAQRLGGQQGAWLRKVRDLPVGVAGRGQVLLEMERTPSPIVRCALQAVLASVDTPDFDTGLAEARRLYEEVMGSEAARALQRAFTGKPA